MSGRASPEPSDYLKLPAACQRALPTEPPGTDRPFIYLFATKEIRLWNSIG